MEIGRYRVRSQINVPTDSFNLQFYRRRCNNSEKNNYFRAVKPVAEVSRYPADRNEISTRFDLAKLYSQTKHSNKLMTQQTIFHYTARSNQRKCLITREN
jgi:hypothetical protein